MKLHWGKHTCAIGIHVLLEEIGRQYELQEWDVGKQETHGPAFLAINPKGKLPTLVRDDGSVLTEYGAIATWLARTNPGMGLIPDDAEGEARVLEAMDYAVDTVHGQGFGRIIKPANFEPDDVLHGKFGLGQSAVKERGREMATEGFAILGRQFGDGPWFAGECFTVADTALFYVERWAAEEGVALPPNLDAHLARTKRRPAVARVIAIWGES